MMLDAEKTILSHSGLAAAYLATVLSKAVALACVLNISM